MTMSRFRPGKAEREAAHEVANQLARAVLERKQEEADRLAKRVEAIAAERQRAKTASSMPQYR
jgi:hypothetical protein